MLRNNIISNGKNIFTVFVKKVLIFILFYDIILMLSKWRDIEVVITGLTRNQFVLTHTRVRIPLSAPRKKPLLSTKTREVFSCFSGQNTAKTSENSPKQGLERLIRPNQPLFFRLTAAKRRFTFRVSLLCKEVVKAADRGI